MGNADNKEKRKILIVDDDRSNIVALNHILKPKYSTHVAINGRTAIEIAKQYAPDLILLDVEMPDMGGFEAMRVLKSDERLKRIPVIFLTAKRDTASEVRGFEMGAVDFVNKPFLRPVLVRRIETHIETDRVIKESQRAVRDIHNATISVIADMVEFRDKITGGHIERTQRYLKILVDELLRSETYADEISGWDLELLLPSAQLHDVGKIVISDLILNKPDKLTAEEFEIIKRHCEEGERIIDSIICKTKDDGFLLHARKFAGCHHERWNGTGYPRKLCGEEIPLEGRILAVADVYDALVSVRPYKRPFSHEQAMDIIKEGGGTQFDPKILAAFIRAADDIGRQCKIHMDSAQL